MPTPKILIVDDEPFNVDFLEQELEDIGCEIIAAVNGQEALDKVQTDMPDLVLLDIMMPVMDGFEVLSRLKSNPNSRDIPVIVISADSDLRSVVKGIQLGAEDYLPKPFEPTLLHARISTNLEKKRLRDLEQLYLKGLEREIDIAREIQAGFLPSELPQLANWDLAACFKAAREVAGDFYDAFVLPDGNLVCVIGDVCGKGVGSALFMTLFRSLIRATSTTDTFIDHKELKPFTPGERLQHVISFTNNYVAVTHGDTNMFATVFIGIFNPLDGSMSYINCGNEPALLVRSGSNLTPLGPTGPVLGIFPDAHFSVKAISMELNDVLLIFTDGILDALNQDNVSFGIERLRNLVEGSDSSATAIIDRIDEHLCQFIGPAAQFDDITLMVVRRAG